MPFLKRKVADRKKPILHTKTYRTVGCGSEPPSADDSSDGYPKDAQITNSYRPHVRSEAGYDIPRKAVAIKAADGTWV